MEPSRRRRIDCVARHLVAVGSSPAASGGRTLSETSLEFQEAEILCQSDILFDAATYSAFPHVIRLQGDELLLSLRQAPVTRSFHHAHPQSIVTVIRSYDAGGSWDLGGATQVAAGGGQELGLIYLGNGVVGGNLAAHEVVREMEAERAAGYAIEAGDESSQPDIVTAYSNQRASWVWSTNYGLTWPLENHLLLDPTDGPFARSHSCSAPALLSSGAICFANYGDAGTGPLGGFQDGSGTTAALPISSVLFISDDQGTTWTKPIVMAQGDTATRGFCEPAVCETSPGNILAVYRVENEMQGQPRELWQNESCDGGHTWSDPRPMGLLAGACARLHMLADGRVLLVRSQHSIYLM